MDQRIWNSIAIFSAEFLGTAMLMLFGCMSLISGFSSPPAPISSIQVGLMFGFVVSSIIVIFGHISGAHLNPSVTLAALILGKVNSIDAIIYFFAQTIGAVAGYGLLLLLTPCEVFHPGKLCVTVPHPSLSTTQAFGAEFLATSLLVFACCSVWDARNEGNSDSVPLKFAFVIAAVAIVEGPYTGGSMNPVRSLAPALYTGEWTQHWIYWIAPLSSAFLTSSFYKIILEKNTHLSVPSSDNRSPILKAHQPKSNAVC